MRTAFRTKLSAACALLAAGLAAPAGAADWYTGAEPPPSAGEDWIVAVGASGSVTSTGTAFAATSGTFAVGGNLSESGPRARIEGLAGRYRRGGADNSVSDRNFGTQVEGTVSAGYQWVADPISVSAYLGLSVRDNSASVLDAADKSLGTKAGIKGALELYMEPSKHTMVAAFGSYSSAYNAYYARVKGGVDVADRVFFGPEVAALGDDFFNQWRAGLHLTGFKVGPVQFSVSAGYLHEAKVGGGVYTMLDARAGF